MSERLQPEDIVTRINDLLSVFSQQEAAPDTSAISLIEVPRGRQFSMSCVLPLGAKYYSRPPRFAQAGTYCFPSGNFSPVSDVGWPMKCNASRYYSQGKRAGERWLYLNCKHCTARISIAVGPFITTMTVFAPLDGAVHVQH